VKIEFEYEELLFLFWAFLLLPWAILAFLSVMAFDGGATALAYIFVLAIWTYPVSVAVVWKFREKIPLVSVLPCFNIVAALISGLKH
jgi:hypothetical protein